ncbi:heme utilization protein, partial [Pseudomonas sp. CCI4.2]|nr:heme utilization protein [Pseudomonas sp. CCI4.2]
TGDYNQQKNNLAIAVSGGRVASASASATQTSSPTYVGNNPTQTFDKFTLKDTVDVTCTYLCKGEGTVANNELGGWGGERSTKDKLAFTDSGTVELSGVATYQVLTPSGWANP